VKAQQFALLAAAVLACANPSAAQPAISGASVAAQAVTITGTGFGDHAAFGGAQPFLNAGWQDFENGAFNGGNMELENSYPRNWTLETSGNRPASRYSITKTNAESRLGEFGLRENSGGMNAMTGTLYVSFWIKVSGINASGKFFRVYGDTFDFFVGTGDVNLALRAYSTCGANNKSVCSPLPITVWGTPQQFEPGRWHRVDIYIRDGSSGRGDYIGVYLDGGLQWRRSSTLPSKRIALEGSSADERQQWIPAKFGGNGHTVAVGQMVEGGGRYTFDDVFVDYTWAHVELGDAPTYAASTKRETQIPLKWSGTQVTAKINAGGFRPGETAYLYVVDAAGVANPKGYPIVLPPATSANSGRKPQ
jgi:hypothetical protein